MEDFLRLNTGEIDLSFKNYQHPRRVIPATISVIVAVLLMIGCALPADPAPHVLEKTLLAFSMGYR
jgi:hypothetical protein